MVSCVLITSNSNGSMHDMQTQTSEQTVWTWIKFDDDGAPPVGHLGVVFSACVDTGSGNGHFHGFVYHWNSKDRCSFSDCSEASGYMHLWWSAILLPDLLGVLINVTTNTHTFTGLQEFNTYTCIIAATNAIGQGLSSSPITFNTTQAGMYFY